MFLGGHCLRRVILQRVPENLRQKVKGKSIFKLCLHLHEQLSDT